MLFETRLHKLIGFDINSNTLWFDCFNKRNNRVINALYKSRGETFTRNMSWRSNEIKELIILIRIYSSFPDALTGILTERLLWMTPLTGEGLFPWLFRTDKDLDEEGSPLTVETEPLLWPQTLWWLSQSLCWQNDPQYLATLHPLQVSLAFLPQFQQF